MKKNISNSKKHNTINYGIEIQPFDSSEYNSPVNYIWYSAGGQMLKGDEKIELLTAATILFDALKDSGFIFKVGDLTNPELLVVVTDSNNGKEFLKTEKLSREYLTTIMSFMFVSQKYNPKGKLVPTLPHKEWDIFKSYLKLPPIANEIPYLSSISSYPRIMKSPGGPVILSKSYDPESQSLALDDIGEHYNTIESLDDAKNILKELVCDTVFRSPSDRSRYLGALFTPALKKGGWLNGSRVGLNLVLANDSQAGKDHIATILANVYGETPHIITDSDSQAGNLDNMLPVALESNKEFIIISNIRGALDSKALEAFTGTTDSMSMRGAYRKGNSYCSSDFSISMTANEDVFNPTIDILNRANIIAINKRRSCDEFTLFGDKKLKIENYIKENGNHKKYLAAIFYIINEWYKQGANVDYISNHNNQKWAGTINAIVHGIMGEAPLFEDYESLRRKYCRNSEKMEDILTLQLYKAGKCQDLSSTDIATFMNENKDIFSAFFNSNEEIKPRGLGLKLSSIFKDKDSIQCFEYKFSRKRKSNLNNYKDAWVYSIEKIEGN